MRRCVCSETVPQIGGSRWVMGRQFPDWIAVGCRRNMGPRLRDQLVLMPAQQPQDQGVDTIGVRHPRQAPQAGVAAQVELQVAVTEDPPCDGAPVGRVDDQAQRKCRDAAGDQAFDQQDSLVGDHVPGERPVPRTPGQEEGAQHDDAGSDQAEVGGGPPVGLRRDDHAEDEADQEDGEGVAEDDRVPSGGVDEPLSRSQVPDECPHCWIFTTKPPARAFRTVPCGCLAN